MGVKIQYNPSTGKASYNPATGKVQVVVSGLPGSCGDCINPNQVSVTISGLTACCADFGVGGFFKFAPDFMSALNSEHVIDSFGSLSNCVYASSFVVDEPDWFLQFGSADCAGSPIASFPIYSFQVIVTNDLTETIQLVQLRFSVVEVQTPQFIQIWSSPLTLPCYDQTLIPSDAAVQDCSDLSLNGPHTTEVINGTVVLAVAP